MKNWRTGRTGVLMLMVLFMGGQAYAPLHAQEPAAAVVKTDRKTLDDLIKEQKILEQRIDALENADKKDRAEISSADQLQDEVYDLSDRLDTVEKKTLLDRLEIAGEFRTRLEFLDYEDRLVNGEKKDTHSGELATGRLRLNLRTEVSKNIIFQGRLSYFKFWGSTAYDKDPGDLYHPSVPDNEGDLHVERAYVDYFSSKWPFCVSFGRLPTGEGPPYEFKNNTTRKATWPMLLVDGEVDAVILTSYLDKWTGLDDAMFRLAYGQLTQNFNNIDGGKLDASKVAGAAFEMGVPGLRGSLLWLSAFRLFNYASLSRSPNPALEITNYPEDAGGMDFYNLHLQAANCFDTGLDFFLSYAYQDISPRERGSVFSNGYEIGVFGDNLTGTLGERRQSYVFYAGLRYTFPFERLMHPKIGIEYNYGSKYWLATPIVGSGDLVNKLTVNGNAWEIYYIQPLHPKNVFCRLGAVHMDYNHYNPSIYIGPQQESDMTLLNTYFLVDVRF